MTMLPIFHYYGDYVRRIFIGVAVVLVLTEPLYPNLMPLLSTMGTVLFVALLIFHAGFTSPANKMTAIGNILIALFGMLLFQYSAAVGYKTEELVIFLVREALALAFMFALYYSTKTIRGMRNG